MILNAHYVQYIYFYVLKCGISNLIRSACGCAGANVCGNDTFFHALIICYYQNNRSLSLPHNFFVVVSGCCTRALPFHTLDHEFTIHSILFSIDKSYALDSGLSSQISSYENFTVIWSSGSGEKQRGRMSVECSIVTMSEW